MRLIDLIIQTLKESIRNDDYSLTVDSILDGSLEKNADYAVEMNNILLSINKAISRFQTADKLQYKHIVIVGEHDRETYDLSEYDDIKNIKSVYVINDGKIQTLGWQNFSKNELYLGYGINTNIHIIYAPKIRNFTTDDIYTQTNSERCAVETDLDQEYGITDEMCNYISYFAKSEIYEDRDPDRCKRYLNYFESYLNELKIDRTFPHQDCVRSPFRLGK